MGLTYGNSLFGMTPVGAGYGSVIPSGASAGAFPIGLGTTTNNQYGGQDFSMPGASTPQTPVWTPPTTPGQSMSSLMGPAPTTQFGTGATTPAAGTSAGAVAPGATGGGGIHSASADARDAGRQPRGPKSDELSAVPAAAF